MVERLFASRRRLDGREWLGVAHAQTRSDVVELTGDATVDGQPLLPNQSAQTGEEVITGPLSPLIFVVGNSAFHVRQNSALTVERGPI